MTIYDENKLNFPDLDLLKTAKNSFLIDIYSKSFKYNLSVKQIEAAKRALAAEQSYGGKSPLDINRQNFNEFDILVEVIESD